MKRNVIAAAALALLLAAACNKQSTTTSTTATPSSTASSSTTVAESTMSPEDLGAVGAQIKAHPGDAKRILSEHGLDETSFEKAIRRVSSDPGASRRYAAAYKSAAK